MRPTGEHLLAHGHALDDLLLARHRHLTRRVARAEFGDRNAAGSMRACVARAGAGVSAGQGGAADFVTSRQLRAAWEGGKGLVAADADDTDAHLGTRCAPILMADGRALV